MNPFKNHDIHQLRAAQSAKSVQVVLHFPARMSDASLELREVPKYSPQARRLIAAEIERWETAPRDEYGCIIEG